MDDKPKVSQPWRRARKAGWITEREYNGEDDGVRNPITGDWAENWEDACLQIDEETSR